MCTRSPSVLDSSAHGERAQGTAHIYQDPDHRARRVGVGVVTRFRGWETRVEKSASDWTKARQAACLGSYQASYATVA